MDFRDTPEEAEFRERVRTWLAENIPDMAHFTYVHEVGADLRAEFEIEEHVYRQRSLMMVNGAAVEFTSQEASGLGLVWLHTRTEPVSWFLTATTPIDDERVELRLLFLVRDDTGTGTMSAAARAMVDATVENTSRDVTVKAGDVLIIPKRPSYVLVQGQVYGPTAVAYRPGKSGKWYLMQAGGPTNLANKKAIFAIHADGTVIGNHGWMSGDALSAALQPGDMVVVPEKPLGGPPIWKTLFQDVQVLSSIATSVILASKY